MRESVAGVDDRLTCSVVVKLNPNKITLDLNPDPRREEISRGRAHATCAASNFAFTEFKSAPVRVNTRPLRCGGSEDCHCINPQQIRMLQSTREAEYSFDD